MTGYRRVIYLRVCQRFVTACRFTGLLVAASVGVRTSPAIGCSLGLVPPLKLINDDESPSPRLALFTDDWHYKGDYLLIHQCVRSNLKLRKSRHPILGAFWKGIHDHESLLVVVMIEPSRQMDMHHFKVRFTRLLLCSDAPHQLGRIKVNVQTRFPTSEPLSNPLGKRI